MEKLEKYWLDLLPALARCCIELSQRNPNNEYWNDNKRYHWFQPSVDWGSSTLIKDLRVIHQSVFYIYQK